VGLRSRYTEHVRLALLLWALAWAFVATPWRSFRIRPSLEHVELIPFLDGSPRTQILNLLVFVPLGFIGIRLGWSSRTVALVGSGVSALTELLQLFSTRRHPSVTDLILNTTGAMIGIALAIAWSHLRAIDAPERRVRP
jgi:glycopeptide antibiotics resistance protein